MSVFTFEFEELPLVIVNGIPAALVNGTAEIRYGRYAAWSVESVALEGYQERTPEERAAGKRPWVSVAAPAELATLIEQRLEDSEWCDRIHNAVQEQLVSDREDDAEMRYEMRRDEARGM